MLHTILALWLAATALPTLPSANKITWMRPEAFHLVIGMSKMEATNTLAENGWEAKKGKDADELVVDYTGERALTLHFVRGRLRSIRFELFAMIPDLRKAFEEEAGYLRDTLGKPKDLKAPTIVLYDGTLPNVMVVLSDSPATENGRKGFGFLVVRYFDPAAM